MIIDETDYPIIEINYDVQENTEIEVVLAKINELLLREKCFVFMCNSIPNEGQQSVEDRRTIALWLKANKVEVERWIKGHIQIVESPENFEEMKAFSHVFKKFWGYPMIIVENLQEAQIAADKLLS